MCHVTTDLLEVWPPFQQLLLGAACAPNTHLCADTSQALQAALRQLITGLD